MTHMVHITPPPLSSQSMTDLLCTIMLLCKGQNIHGQHFWAYMCIKPSMAEAFKKARDSGDFNLEDFGTIIECGVGEEVPEDVARRMERDYGVRHDFEQQLIDAIEAMKRQKPE